MEFYFIILVSWGRGVPHVSVTHTPLTAVSIFNKFLNLKNFTPLLEGVCRSLYHETKPGTAGRETLNMMTELMDEQGNIINEPNKPGEIVGRGPHTMIGYLKNPEKTLEAFKYDWFHSGDIGIWDKDHYLYVIDRKKDMIKTGGENVSSREVEEVIYKHPAVKEVAVIGLPDEKWIERVTAVVVLKDNYQKSEKLKEEIMEYARNNLAHFKAPKEIIFVDSLPKSPSGKILKRELREQFKSRKEFKKEMQ